MKAYPKIGIRPIIDGRLGGVRESLEEKTMQMAVSLSELIRKNLRYPDGTCVESVIADTCIGGVKEAADCQRKFDTENIACTISVTPCWAYGTETMDYNLNYPKAIWGFNGTERPGAVYLAATKAAYNQKGIPVFSIYGKNVQDLHDNTIPDDVREKLLRFAKAGLVLALMKGKSYLAIGSVSMGIAGSEVSSAFFQEYLGMRNEYVDATEVLRRIEQDIFDREEFDRAMKWTREKCREGVDYNDEDKQRSRENKDKDWEFVVKMTLIIRDLMTGNPVLDKMGFGEEAMGHEAIAAGFQGQRQWTDFLPNGDFSEAILNSSFDWNGKRAPYILATENDALNGVSMLFNYLLTNTAQIFADVRTYWSPSAVERVTGWQPEGIASKGFIHLINSGAACLDGTGRQATGKNPAIKPHWEITDREVEECLDATIWSPASLGYFRGGGYSSTFLTRGGMPLTMCRLNQTRGLGPTLQIAEGWSTDLPENVHKTLNDRTDKTWPTTWFVPRTMDKDGVRTVYDVMARWGSNHGAISYGHIGAELITLASMLRIPVSYHNIEHRHIFRPATWEAFGMDPENADFRACKVFGPLYR
ncbi:L-fucose isomerase [Sinomicrobium soli]|uniref:L-fucose isomerase n=1 Tax=Sinomicrobium sp. N-1-3-6 TaxID=2219864 RepID=UPI000DCEB365|nr:L-fucose isomerase [Sinomicrobium sp. N-1-3-6]RAV30353.1 L-fucose isomerase [Sinomicrobium sp. N-1-3-6]